MDKAPSPCQTVHTFQRRAEKMPTLMPRLMSGDIIRKPRPKYSIANEKLVQNAKKNTIETIYISIEDFMHNKFVLILEICYLIYRISLLKC